MRCKYVASKKRWQPNSCNFTDCPRQVPKCDAQCCYMTSEDSIKVRGTGEGYLRKCLVCGLEAKTTEDLKLFKKRPSYPYGVDAICISCHTERNKEHAKHQRIVDPMKTREAVRRCNQKDVGRQKAKARGYSYLHLKADTKCAECGALGVPLQKHHPDYSRPDFVITLCRKCHTKHKPNAKPVKPKVSLCQKCSNKIVPSNYREGWHCLGHNADVCRSRERWFKCSKFAILEIKTGVH